jgi:hypothetical protein
MAAISRTLVAGTWLKILRYQCTMHRCQIASLTRLAALVALRIAQPVRFGLQQRVQRLLHAPSHDLVEVVLYLIRSSSIVMRLFSGLGVISVMAAPSR